MLRACAFAAFVGHGALLSQRRSKQRERQMRIWNKRAAAHSKDRIFVFMPTSDWAQASRTVSRLLAACFIPQRVVVGVLGPPGPVPVMAPCDGLQGQVRSAARKLSVGDACARQEIRDRLYQRERYVLFASDRSEFMPDWDQMLLLSLRGAYALGAHLVTHVPCDVTEQQIRRLPAKAPPTFAVLSTEKIGRCPAFLGRLFRNSGRQYESPCVSSRCLFGEASVVLDHCRLLDHLVPFTSPEEEDFIMSVKCFALSVRAVNPTHSAVFRRVCEEDAPPPRAPTEALGNYRRSVLEALIDPAREHRFPKGKLPSLLHFLQTPGFRTVGQYLEHIGVSDRCKSKAGRMVLGLLKGHTEREVSDKFGSRDEFEFHRKRFTL